MQVTGKLSTCSLPRLFNTYFDSSLGCLKQSIVRSVCCRSRVKSAVVVFLSICNEGHKARHSVPPRTCVSEPKQKSSISCPRRSFCCSYFPAGWGVSFYKVGALPRNGVDAILHNTECQPKLYVSLNCVCIPMLFGSRIFGRSRASSAEYH